MVQVVEKKKRILNSKGDNDMSFLDELRIVEEFEGFRFCEWIEINDEYYLSIQCGEGKYSIPRINVDLDQYTHFEIAFIYEGELSDMNNDILKGFKRKEELQEYQEGTVYPFVPKDLIEDLYKHLKSI